VRLVMASLSTLVLTVGTNAQKSQVPVAKHYRYRAVDLGTVGDPGSTVSCCMHQITARGIVVRGADTANVNRDAHRPRHLGRQ